MLDRSQWVYIAESRDVGWANLPLATVFFAGGFLPEKRCSLRVALLLGTSIIVGSPLEAARANVNYYYDGAGKLRSVIDSVNGSVIYNYDSAGNILSVTTAAASQLLVAQSSPVSASVGQTITVVGTSFVSGSTTLTFNGVAATVSNVTPTSLTAAVPAGATSGPLAVTTPAGSASSCPTLTALPCFQFTVSSASAPTITQPGNPGVSAGSTLTLSGTGFDANPLNDSVFVNNRPVEVLGSTSNSLSISLPLVGSGPISIRTPHGTAATASNLIVEPTLCYPSCFFETCSDPCTVTPVSVGGTVALPAVGSSVTVSLSAETSGSGDEVLFYATAGTQVGFLPTSSSWDAAGSSGPQIQLLGPDGLLVSSSANISAVTTSFIPVQMLTETGFYALALGTTGLPSTGNVAGILYNIPPITMGSLTISSSGQSNSIAENITTPGQEMGATFSGNGQRLALLTNITGLETLDQTTSLTVLAANGVIQYQSYFENGTTNFSGPFVLNQPGNTTYEISVVPPVGTITGSSSFTLYTVPPDVTGTLAIGGATAATITTPGQSVIETFTNSGSTTLNLALEVGYSQGTSAINVTVAPVGGGAPIMGGLNKYWGGSIENSGVFQAPPGTYIITAGSPYTTTTGTVSLDLFPVQNNDVSVLPNGVSNTYTTTTPDQELVASLSNSNTAKVVAVGVAINTSIGCGTATVYAPPPPPEYDNNDSGTALWTPSGCYGLQAYKPYLPLSSIGTYTIDENPAVINSSLGNATSTETLTVYNVTTQTGNLPGIAQPGTVTNGHVAGIYLEKYVSPASQTVVLTSMASFSGFSVTVTDQSGTQLYVSSSSSSSNISTELTLSAGGTYSIQVIPDEPVSGSTTFTLNSYSGNSSIPMMDIGHGSPSITPGNGGMTEVAFNAHAGQRVALLLDTGTNQKDREGHCFSVDVMRPDGSTLYHKPEECGADFSGVLSSGNPNEGLPTSGEYTIQYRSLTGPGFVPRFTLYDVSSDIVVDMAQNRSAMLESTTAPGQAVRVGFSGRKDESLVLTINPRTFEAAAQCERASVVDAVGKLLVGELACGHGFTKRLILPQNGSYTAIVKPTGTTIGSYDIGIFD